MLRVGAVLGSVPALAFVYTTSSREQRLSSLTFIQSPHLLDWVYPAWCIIVHGNQLSNVHYSLFSPDPA